jgi:hypothetical protein
MASAAMALAVRAFPRRDITAGTPTTEFEIADKKFGTLILNKAREPYVRDTQGKTRWQTEGSSPTRSV